MPVTAQSLRLAQGAPAAQAPAALESLAIVSGDKRHSFQVEVMRTPEQRARGLMHRRYMPADRGMLFDFGRTEPVAMWMENTYIPLDMLFIRADGTIARIAENTEPLSQRTIPSGEPVLSVLGNQWRRQPHARSEGRRPRRARIVPALSEGRALAAQAPDVIANRHAWNGQSGYSAAR